MAVAPIAVRYLGLVDFQPTYEAMRHYTATRNEYSLDQLWLLEHPPVFTLGLAGNEQHLLEASNIPLVRIDRGGQITYHGPGQLVIYLLLDLARRELKVREFVCLIEQSIIDCLAELGVTAERRVGAPGVYVDGAKIAALGLKISRSCSYHGLSLNVDMDLAPFAQINPCGHVALPVVDLRRLGVNISVTQSAAKLAEQLRIHLHAAKFTVISV